MKKVLLCFLFISNLQFHTCFSQDITKIGFSNLRNQIITADAIGYAGIGSNTSPLKAIGYNIPSSTLMNFGVLVMDKLHNINFNMTYSSPYSNLFVIKITTPNATVTDIYVLVGVQSATNSNVWNPLILKINNTTGNVVWAKTLTIPNPTIYSSCMPKDIVFQSANHIQILCEANYQAPNPGSPVSDLILCDFNIAAFTFNIQELYNSALLNSYFRNTNFVKTYHWGIYTHNAISFYGIMSNGGTDKGFVYMKDVSNVEYYRSYYLNNANTSKIQASAADDDQYIHLCMQNLNNEILLEKSFYTINGSLSWRKYYIEIGGQFRLSNGAGHGMKNSIINLNDFLIGYHGQIGDPSYLNGYEFIRFNTNTGSITQSYWYDLNMNDYSNMHSLDDDYIDESSFIATGNISVVPFIYLMEKTLSANPSSCTNTSSLQEESMNFEEVNEAMTTIIDPTIYGVLSETITTHSVTTTLTTACADQRSFYNNGIAENSIFPSPEFIIHNNSNQIAIKSTKKSIEEINIFSMDGKCVLSKKCGGSKREEFILSNISSGLYLVRVGFDDKSIISQEILIKN
jgi:hypothetical protein